MNRSHFSMSFVVEKCGTFRPRIGGEYTRNGKLQLIRPDQLAQYLAAFRGLPVAAYKDKATLFTTHRETVFPPDLRVEEAIIAWLAADAAESAVRESIAEAREHDDEQQISILKRGGKIFTVAMMGTILSERTGGTYLNRITRETASSEATRKRLAAYARIATAWHVEVSTDLLEKGIDLNQLVRSQDLFSRVRSKALLKWKVQSMSRKWVDDALPKI